MTNHPISTTTTEYGVWSNYTSEHTIADSVDRALGENSDDYDFDGLVDCYRAYINEELAGTGICLCGDTFYGPYPKTDVDIKEHINNVELFSLLDGFELNDNYGDYDYDYENYRY